MLKWNEEISYITEYQGEGKCVAACG